MATVSSFTAERMKAIEDNAIVDGSIVGDNLVLTKHNGETVDAGNVRGPSGPPGDITGEVGVPKPFMLSTLPEGHGWCDAQTEYNASDYPILSAEFGTGASCINGASSVGKFRLPDLRRKVLIGLDPTVVSLNALHKVGGSKDAAVVLHNHSATQPAHAHTATQAAHNHNTDAQGYHSHGVAGDSPDAERIVITYEPSSVFLDTSTGQSITYSHLDYAGSHGHNISSATPGISVGSSTPAITVNNSGVSSSDANLPPFRVVNYIMRLA